MSVFNAAMQTELPTTSLMVHIAGHGPRRVYRRDTTGRYFIYLNGGRMTVDPVEMARRVGS